MKYSRILSIGAHSLDAELMGGPLMIRYAKAGAKCTFVHVTSGRLENADATQEEKDAYVERILEENKQAAKKMFCDSYNMNYLSSQLPSTGEFVDILCEYIKKEKADLIITHARGTMHARHYYVYDTVTMAVQKLIREGYEIDLLYGENCEDLVGFIPTMHFALNQEDIDTWFEGLREYALFNGKVNSVPYYDYYNSMLKVRRIEAGSLKPVKSYMHAPLIVEKL